MALARVHITCLTGREVTMLLLVPGRAVRCAHLERITLTAILSGLAQQTVTIPTQAADTVIIPTAFGSFGTGLACATAVDIRLVLVADAVLAGLGNNALHGSFLVGTEHSLGGTVFCFFPTQTAPCHLATSPHLRGHGVANPFAFLVAVGLTTPTVPGYGPIVVRASVAAHCCVRIPRAPAPSGLGPQAKTNDIPISIPMIP